MKTLSDLNKIYCNKQLIALDFIIVIDNATMGK